MNSKPQLPTIAQAMPENSADGAEGLFKQGNSLRKLERYEDALECFDKALAYRPDFANALILRGLTLQKLKRREEALESYDDALTIKPDSAVALNNRGSVLNELKRFREALESYDLALTIKPDFAEALNNRGLSLHELRRTEDAIASFDKALTLKPDFASAWTNRGDAHLALMHCDEALASYGRALALKPDNVVAHWHASNCRLLTGDFERGWQGYEWRWKLKGAPPPMQQFAKPLWLGTKSIEGKTILLHSEQGFGDTIQFARYAQLVAQRGAKVILVVQPTLKSLLSSVRGVDHVLGRDEPLPEFDFHCPLMSLPLAFNTRLETIPEATPYIRPAVAGIKKWEAKLGGRKAFTIGVAWSGRPTHANDWNRSIGLNKLLALKRPNVRLVSLQTEVRAEDAAVLAVERDILHFGTQLEDFSDTAALVYLMDLVISVDTSVAHLAGALGKPVWILLPYCPDWRWLTAREDSPWYPSARLFRQPKIGDWDSVLEKVKQHLSSFDNA